ncbi:MFS transporter [Gordonia sp. VNK21]|uniref:MFS transporter n=1 Tax=Gordonia sp. VNK21 TaxID=3382483 RepID=UPI0038D477AD
MSSTRTEKPAVRSGAVVAVLALAGIVVSLMQTLIIPIIPKLPEYLHAAPDDTAWTVTATLLAAAVATPTMGRLGDMYGKRRLLLVSVVLMTAGSIVGALSSTVLTMIIGRTLQGLSAGVIPLGISILRDVVPKEKLAGSVAVMSASLGVGGAFGLPIAALIADNASWHMLFWVSAVLGAVSFVAIAVIVPESPERSGGGFDVAGAVTMSAGLVALLLGVSKGASWGWTSTATLGCFIVAVIAFAAWTAWELRARTPLVDVRVAARPQVLFTNIASVAFGFAMFATSMVFPQVVQLPEATGSGLGGSLLVAGLVMAPMGLMLLLAAPVSSRITNSAGPRTTLMLGAVIVAAGYFGGAYFLDAEWQLVLIGVVIGAGTGLAYGAMPALIMGAVPASQTGAANSFNTLMRSLGTSFASAVSGVIVAQMTVTLGGREFASGEAFSTIMLIAGGAAVLALLATCAIPRSSGLETSAVNVDAERESVAAPH